MLTPPASDTDEGQHDGLDDQRPGWRYDQPSGRGHSMCYLGTVHPVGGVEGDRLRRELTAVLRDLLDWIADQEVIDGRLDNGPGEEGKERHDSGR